MENLDFDSDSQSTITKSIKLLLVTERNQTGDAAENRASLDSADSNYVTTIDKFGGYAFRFVLDPLPDELSNLLCKICHLPSKDPHLSRCCGHTFCKSCADHSKKKRSM